MTQHPVGPTEVEIEELLGAYALDALEPDERAMVDAHLRTCVRCSAEVARHHEVAGLLANAGGDAPDLLWDRIAERLDEPSAPSWESLAARLEAPAMSAAGSSDAAAEGRSSSHDAAPAPAPVSVAAATDPAPVASVVPISASRRRSRLTTVFVSVVAAAAALAAIVLGVQVHHLNRQVSALSAPHQTVTMAAQTALEDPTTQRVQLTPTPTSAAPRSAVVTLVLSKSGTGYIIVQGLTALPAQETYQLWGSISGQLISLGVLGPNPKVTAFSFDSGVKVQAFAITAEQAGGVVQTTHVPMVEGTVQA